jgi:hypothetical protein
MWDQLGKEIFLNMEIREIKITNSEALQVLAISLGFILGKLNERTKIL